MQGVDGDLADLPLDIVRPHYDAGRITRALTGQEGEPAGLDNGDM